MRRMCREPARFTLGQMIRVLTLHSGREALEKNLRLRPWLSLAFPASEVISAVRTQAEQSEEEYWDIEATSFGLYSTLGPLPTFYTEELFEEARQDSSVSRDFLDIINDRLFKLRHNANLHDNVGRRTAELDERAAQEVLFAFMGQPSAAFRQYSRPQTEQMAFLANHRRTAEGLAQFLHLYLDGRAVSVEQCVPRSVPVRTEQRCRLGLQCATLGQDAVLGQQVPDITCAICIHLHDVPEEDMHTYLPAGTGHARMALGIRQYMDTPLLYEVLLHPHTGRQPCRQLGLSARCGAYLGDIRQAAPVRVHASSFQDTSV